MKAIKTFAAFLVSCLFIVSSINLTTAHAASAASVNLIPNPSVETSSDNLPTSWSEGGWGTNKAVFNYYSGGYASNHALEITMSNYSSGDAKWYFTPITVNPNTLYNFSDYYISNVATQVIVQLTDTSGNNTYLSLGNVAASLTWKQASFTFTTPANVAKLTVFHAISANGYFLTDNYSLAQSTAPAVQITSPVAGSTVSGTTTLTASANNVSSVQFQLDGQNISSAITSAPYQMTSNSINTSNGTHVLTAVARGTNGSSVTSSPVIVYVSNATTASGNVIPNANLSIVNPSNSTLPADWTEDNWGSNTASFSYENYGYNDSHSLYVNMTKYSSGDAKWSFTAVPVIQDTQYKFSEYLRSNVQTQVMAAFNMSDGTTEYQYIGLPDTQLNWTNFTTTFSVPLGANTMTIYHLINKVGALNTDDFSLTPYTPTGFSEPLLTLTFDDGYSSTYDYGYPLLKQYGYNSTQFIITNLLNTDGYMTNSDVQSLYNNQQEIASHTVTHSDLTQEATRTMQSELSQSKATLQSITGHSVTNLAYPYGLYNNNVLAATKANYSGARGVEDGLNSKDNFNAYDIKAQNVFLTTTTAQIADWVKQAQMTNTWLVLVYHSVDPDTNSPIDGDEYNVTPTELSSELAAIKASGIKVETMQAALNEIEPQL